MRLITDQELSTMSTESKRRRHQELDRKLVVASQRGWSCAHRIEASRAKVHAAIQRDIEQGRDTQVRTEKRRGRGANRASN
ncbi:MAG: toluene tolerance protein [Achromobacter sp.]|uniref:toluene tolerance protein n=1 Tax=Achromobacter sp. TaxID=134375 RepID=UPI003D087595